jgi:A/G-specific adenine glycosylase
MEFCNHLVSWYLENKRDLPWRKSKDPYKVWLSEIILQQTRVAQGSSYYEKFATVFTTVFELAKADERDVLKLWQGLGYYSRARNLHFSAKYIVNECNGTFPATYKDLLLLKGVGDYTASAIASICFGEAKAVVDGNVYRVLSRFYGVETPINSTKGIKEFKELAQAVMYEEDPGLYNQAIMDFGAMQCKPQNPDCNNCPLQYKCVAFHQKRTAILPVKEKKIKIRKRYFNFIVLLSREGKTQIVQRKGKGIWENLFQFPLIESETSMEMDTMLSHPEFLSLSNNEDVIVKCFNSKEWVHKLSHQHLYVKFWLVKGNFGEAQLMPWEEIESYAVPRIIHLFLEKFQNPFLQPTQTES